MPDIQATIFIGPDEPAPIARAKPYETGRVLLSMPGALGIHGEPDQIRAWLQSGLDALADGLVRWTATEAQHAGVDPDA